MYYEGSDTLFQNWKQIFLFRISNFLLYLYLFPGYMLGKESLVQMLVELVQLMQIGQLEIWSLVQMVELVQLMQIGQLEIWSLVQMLVGVSRQVGARGSYLVGGTVDWKHSGYLMEVR